MTAHHDPLSTHPDRMLKTEDVVSFLGVSRRTVAKLASTGQLRSVKVGRNRRFRLGDLAAFVESLPSRGGAG